MNADEYNQAELEQRQMEEEFERIDECMEAIEEMSKPWWIYIDADLDFQEEMR